MTSISENNKRIAKNTLFLYFRMLFLMVISLFTSRVVLNALGVEDFGIYNVVGGIVAMFSLLSGSLSTAISRFITYELGKKRQENLNKIFSSAITIQLLLAGIIILFAELIGVWFLNTQMTIPKTRLIASNWVFQISLLTFVINLISVPFNAYIIAHEKMSAFAYISILEAIGKLIIAYLISISPIDKLIFYSIIMCLMAIIMQLTYTYYCKSQFKECTYQFIWDKKLLKQMFSFAGWNFIGTASAILRDQGGNILINLFNGPVVNAARGIAFQVNNAMQGFVTNFMIALNPQIIKSYAANDNKYMMTLIFQGARLSFYMLLIFSLPILLNTQYILKLWLKTVPEHSVLFVQLVLILAMSESISCPLITAIQATGKIRNYQLLVGGLQLLNFPISYILLHWGYFPEIIMVVAIILTQVCLGARLYMLQKIIKLSTKEFLKKVYINIILVSFLSALIPFTLLRNISNTFINFVLSSILTIICSIIVIYYIGCNAEERTFITTKIKHFKEKVLHN